MLKKNRGKKKNNQQCFNGKNAKDKKMNRRKWRNIRKKKEKDLRSKLNKKVATRCLRIG